MLIKHNEMMNSGQRNILTPNSNFHFEQTYTRVQTQMHKSPNWLKNCNPKKLNKTQINQSHNEMKKLPGYSRLGSCRINTLSTLSSAGALNPYGDSLRGIKPISIYEFRRWISSSKTGNCRSKETRCTCHLFERNPKRIICIQREKKIKARWLDYWWKMMNVRRV